MGVMTYLPLVLVAAVVLVPLGREYADFRRTWGLTRVASAATTLLVLPALGAGLALAYRVGGSYELQWVTAVVVTLAVYSVAAAAVRSALEPARSPRRPA